ncbi:SGNH/GDSL hydrolase family protein [Leekyejoonella antrihumi]|uniref:SGNH/GDSL hydrolase family protein n=1 Tax=Leekyejoonella antrihumi TaxID=1660198 RepID=A0A563E4B0_9MICO|nr:SGNH/GDSL hydrolase family protein [Leekyejoonella antrihumi]TWP37041.1 SGNH/GDSL hydrolase family protein [Leekyejoonella antrihumi]
MPHLPTRRSMADLDHGGRTRAASAHGTIRGWLTRLVVLLAAVALIEATSAAPALASQPRHPAQYYLSLGDSLAFGYQPNQVDTNPANFRSYAEDYAAFTPRLRLVNYGCPSETTGTFINGGCPWTATDHLPLHNSYGTATSQLGATEAFLTAHRGQVSLVSLDLGNNDLLALVYGCEAGEPSNLLTCIETGLPGTLSTMATNLGRILATVHQLAPNAQIALFNLYNPLALALPGSDALIAVVNQQLAKLATAYDARLVNAFGAINIKAGSFAEKISVCVLTWECTSKPNIHPTTLGYFALTGALARAVR